MRILPAICLLMIGFALASCVSIRPDQPNDKLPRDQQVRTTAYVTNPEEFAFEYRALRHCPDYTLVQDSLAADVLLELSPVVRYPSGCLTPQFTVGMLTLGFYPVTWYERYTCNFTQFRDGDRSAITRDVSIRITSSWFHLFSPKKSRKRAIGRAL